MYIKPRKIESMESWFALAWSSFILLEFSRESVFFGGDKVGFSLNSRENDLIEGNLSLKRLIYFTREE